VELQHAVRLETQGNMEAALLRYRAGIEHLLGYLKTVRCGAVAVWCSAVQHGQNLEVTAVRSSHR